MFVSRRSQKADQQEGSFLNAEFPPSTVTSSSTKQNDHKTTVSTSQVKTHAGLMEPSSPKLKRLWLLRFFLNAFERL